MATVKQPSALPTNKLTAAMVGGALVSVVRVIMDNVAPSWSDGEMWVAITPLVILAIGYFVKDAPNGGGK